LKAGQTPAQNNTRVRPSQNITSEQCFAQNNVQLLSEFSHIVGYVYTEGVST